MEAVRSPISACLDEERISSQAVQMGSSTASETVSAVAAGFVTCCIEKSSEFFGETVIGDTLDLVLLDITEGWQARIKLKPGKQLLHVEHWTQRVHRVGHHGDYHGMVSKLIGLAVVKQHHTDIMVGWEAYLPS